MAKTAIDPFAIFVNNEVKKAKIEALNGYEITYRELTMHESDAFTTRLIKGVKDDGTADVDFTEANKIKYEKLSLILIDPKKTVEELEAMSASAGAAINEINALVEDKKDEVDDEGNSEA